jgi:hypothetical protein
MLHRIAWLFALLLACGPSHPTASPPAAPAPDQPSPEQPMTAVRPTPWTLVYADGSANVYTFKQPAAGADVVFEYDPVRPEESSTGMYSGGEPRTASIPAADPRVAELWNRVEKLEATTTLHQPDRGKGTGAFALTTPAGTRQFIIAMGAELSDFHAFAAAF